MPIRYHSEIQDDCLWVKIEGSLCSAEEMVNYVGKVHEDLSLTGLSKVLADETRCHVHMNLQTLGEALKEIHKSDHLQVPERKSAVVSSNINHMLFQHIFNSVKHVQVFTDMDAARTWLMEE
ncbi:hypothetical protein [uncultured Pseudodesulfovibrio sp.]|uniref:hypothetical protein n=1 Tax=uncultured Pseudodesulfovibrio sp. TaxID=2035858 RepID=UPI0029C6D7D6|nr:hypothetical protein [uncultured Pseudodesulfovibrio sp.]